MPSPLAATFRPGEGSEKEARPERANSKRPRAPEQTQAAPSPAIVPAAPALGLGSAVSRQRSAQFSSTLQLPPCAPATLLQTLTAAWMLQNTTNRDSLHLWRLLRSSLWTFRSSPSEREGQISWPHFGRGARAFHLLSSCTPGPAGDAGLYRSSVGATTAGL